MVKSLISKVNREAEGSSFDWFKSYADIVDIIRELIPDKNARILMLGCGNSTLSEDVSPDASYLRRAFNQYFPSQDVQGWLQKYCKCRCE